MRDNMTRHDANYRRLHGLRTRDVVVGLLIGWFVTSGGAASCVAEDATSTPYFGQSWKLALATNVILTMVWIPPGQFVMGSPPHDLSARSDESPPTQVTLTRGFWLGKTAVTIGQWKSMMGVGVRGQLVRMLRDDTLYSLGGTQQTVRAFMRFSRDTDPDQYLAGESDDLPMYFVSWNDALEFCGKLNERERRAGRLPAGYEYNLPTEAQFEYACRAGATNAAYAVAAAEDGSGRSGLGAIAWYNANSWDGYTGKGFKVSGRTGGPRPVAQKQPNAWGLYDMLGNVWQWCRDGYGPYPGGTVKDPIGRVSGMVRVNRGGSFGSGPRDERSASRAKNPLVEASAYRGFRLALGAVQ